MSNRILNKDLIKERPIIFNKEWLRTIVKACIEKTDYPIPQELLLSTQSR